MFTGMTAVIVLVIDWAVRLALATHVIMRRRPVTTSLAWLAVVLCVPIVGLIMYLLVGENRMGGRRVAAYNRLTRSLERETTALWGEAHAATEEFDRDWGHVARFGTAVAGFPPLRGNKLSLHVNAEETLESIIRDTDAATSHVHILSYIWMRGGKPAGVALALIRAKKRGVTCRVLLDGVGSKKFLRSRECAALRSEGIKVVQALPVNPFRMLFSRLDLRNHRKIVEIDGHIAYAGSQNITDSTFRSKRSRKTGPWVDATVRIQGPSAQALGFVFLRDWILDSGEQIEDLRSFLPPLPPSVAESASAGSAVHVIPSGPGPAPEAIHQALLTTIYSARDELVMTTPYFVPDDATRMALQAAATRGVQVTLVMPAVSDSILVAAASRSHYLDLLEAGVRIMHFEGGLLHAKTVTVDRRIALVGSANFDARSFFLNFEITLIVYDDDFASVIRFMQTEFMSRSREIVLSDWRCRSSRCVFRDNAAQLLGPLL